MMRELHPDGRVSERSMDESTGEMPDFLIFFELFIPRSGGF
ncbi:hypothetical protein F750_4411 [Streptomyces sp. PAMC 26508]|nr:hypothetical protein F750_4411 [Streptomyces sp. PAMC 26508]